MNENNQDIPNPDNQEPIESERYGKISSSGGMSSKQKYILIAMTIIWLFYISLSLYVSMNTKPKRDPSAKEMKVFKILPYVNIIIQEESSNAQNAYNKINTNFIDYYKEQLKSKPDDKNYNIKLITSEIILYGSDESSQGVIDYKKFIKNVENSEETAKIFETLYLDTKKKDINKEQASELEKSITETMPGWTRDYSLYKLYKLTGNKTGTSRLFDDAWKKITSMGFGIFLLGIIIFSFFMGLFLLLYLSGVIIYRSFTQPKNTEQVESLNYEKSFLDKVISYFTFDNRNSLEGRGIRQKDNARFVSILFWKAWLSFLVWEFSRNLLSFLVMIFVKKFDSMPTYVLFTMTLIKYAITIGFVFLIFKGNDSRFDPSEIGLKKESLLYRFFDFVMGAGGYCVALPLVISGTLLYRAVTGTTPVSQNPAFNFMDKQNSHYEFIMLFLLVGVIGPIFEEFLFRGVLYTSLRKILPAPASIFLISSLFAVIHFDPNVMIGLFILGMVMNVLYERTGSLIPSIVTHCLWNSITFMLYTSLYS